MSVATGGVQERSPVRAGCDRVSFDGRFAAFVTGADDLVAGDTNGFDDVFVHDRAANTTEARERRIRSGMQGSNSEYPRSPPTAGT